MPSITIRDRKQTDQGFEATVSFNGSGDHPITVANPFNAEEETDLSLYFKQRSRASVTEKDQAARVKGSIKACGEKLFWQVFRRNDQVYSQYCYLRDRSEIEISIESPSPQFQALPWETLWDPDQDEPLAVQGPLVRRLAPPKARRSDMAPSPYLKLLLVTARPATALGHQTMARPLIEAIESDKLPVEIELLRPATYAALQAQLEARKGAYHVVQIDAPGALLTREALQALQKTPACPEIIAGLVEDGSEAGEDSQKAYLALEGHDGQAVLVEAQTLATLLKNQGVPVCVLSTGQSEVVFSDGGAPNPGGDGGGLFSPLTAEAARCMLGAGLPTVVAPGDSATVLAATAFIAQFYTQLLSQEAIPVAICAARRELYLRKRRAHGGQAALADWPLPAVYCDGAVDLNLRELTSEEAEAQLKARRSRDRLDALTAGFVGRDLDILALERSLHRHNVVLLQGVGGAGKTTLLHYLRQWWQTTRFAEKVLYFGYDERAWTVAQIVSAVGQQIYAPNEAAKFQALAPSEKMAKLSEFLRTHPYALILDNLESVTGQPLLTQNTLTPDQQQALKAFLSQLKGGQTKVVLGSRSREQWLTAVLDTPSGVNRYGLKGLDPDARSQLTERILRHRGNGKKAIAALQRNPAFQRLMTLLAGYPLAMEVILADLQRQTPEQVLATLQAAAGLASAEVLNQGHNEIANGGQANPRDPLAHRLAQQVAYFHSDLSPDMRRLLLCLAPFQSVLRRDLLPRYIRKLQQQAAFQDNSFEQFDLALDEAIAQGLLSPVGKKMPQMLTIQPLFRHLIDTKLKALDNKTQVELRQAYKAYYKERGNHYRKLMNSKQRQERQTGLACCRLEYENLQKTLQICLDEQDTIEAFYCLRDCLRIGNNTDGWSKLSQHVYDTQAQYAADLKTGQLGIDMAMVTGDLATCRLLSKDYAAAEQLYWEAITLAEALTKIDEQFRQVKLRAVSFHQLGIVAQKQRQWQQAVDNFNQALTLKTKYGDPYGQACTYHQLGVVAQEQWQWQQAIDYFKQALTIKIEYGDFPGQANTYHQLGMVAQEQRQWQQAVDYFNQAVAIKIKYGNRADQARLYTHLGTIAQEQRQWQQAVDDYGKALEIYLEYGDRANQARTHHSLGIITQEEQQWQQAADHYSQALEIYLECGDSASQARTYYNLSVVMQAQRQWQQAIDHCRQALKLYLDAGDRASQARAYFQLGVLARERRRWQQANEYLNQALTIYMAYGDRYNQAQVYSQLGRVAEDQGDWPTAAESYLEDLRITAEFQDETGRQTSLGNLARVCSEYRNEAFWAQVAEVLEGDGDGYLKW
ncbi:MAG: tetratricopeptide repeat protein [Elainellaceae cyanobacterium]